jgi:hypothetical protein
MRTQWLLLGMVALLVAVPALALIDEGNQEGSIPSGQGGVRSDEGIDPHECNWVHNIGACEGQAPPTEPSDDAAPPTPDDPAQPRPADPVLPVEPVEPPAGPPAPPGRQPGMRPPPSGPTMKELAPIEGVDILTLESFPPRYTAHVRYGLPNGCARPGGYDVLSQADEVHVSVYYLRPADPRTICTMIYGIAEVDVPLGSGFAAGQTYAVVVNGTRHTFTAQ